MTLTKELLEKAIASNGGINADQLEILGLSFPPKTGWKKQSIGMEISESDYQKLLRYKNTSKRVRKELKLDEVQPSLF